MYTLRSFQDSGTAGTGLLASGIYCSLPPPQSSSSSRALLPLPECMHFPSLAPTFSLSVISSIPWLRLKQISGRLPKSLPLAQCFLKAGTTFTMGPLHRITRKRCALSNWFKNKLIFSSKRASSPGLQFCVQHRGPPLTQVQNLGCVFDSPSWMPPTQPFPKSCHFFLSLFHFHTLSLFAICTATSQVQNFVPPPQKTRRGF